MRSLFTTQHQNCYYELIMKEANSRLAWKMKYGQTYPKSFTSPSRRAKAKAVAFPKLPLPSRTKSPPLSFRPEYKMAPSPKSPPVSCFLSENKMATSPQVNCDLNSAPSLMRPVTAETKEVLYQGFSREGKGRHLYLRQRIQKGPEEKFDHPILTSWEYGWRLGDCEQKFTSSNGRSGIVRSTFYAKNGIFNVPSATDQLG